mgnify:CR=1 FL=1
MRVNYSNYNENKIYLSSFINVINSLCKQHFILCGEVVHDIIAPLINNSKGEKIKINCETIANLLKKTKKSIYLKEIDVILKYGDELFFNDAYINNFSETQRQKINGFRTLLQGTFLELLYEEELYDCSTFILSHTFKSTSNNFHIKINYINYNPMNNLYIDIDYLCWNSYIGLDLIYYDDIIRKIYPKSKQFNTLPNSKQYILNSILKGINKNQCNKTPIYKGLLCSSKYKKVILTRYNYFLLKGYTIKNAPFEKKYKKERCCICMNMIKKSDSFSIKKCGHVFHQKCIFNWWFINTKQTCPYDRGEIKVFE